MPRREPLIVHMDAEDADKIRRSAEESGLSVSSYIRMILSISLRASSRAIEHAVDPPAAVVYPVNET